MENKLTANGEAVRWFQQPETFMEKKRANQRNILWKIIPGNC